MYEPSDVPGLKVVRDSSPVQPISAGMPAANGLPKLLISIWQRDIASARILLDLATADTVPVMMVSGWLRQIREGLAEAATAMRANGTAAPSVPVYIDGVVQQLDLTMLVVSLGTLEDAKQASTMLAPIQFDVRDLSNVAGVA